MITIVDEFVFFRLTIMLIFLFLQIPVSFRIQVKDVNGKWIPGTPIPNTIMVNTGDLLQFWTNGFYPATVNHAMSIFHEIFIKQKRYFSFVMF